MNRIDLCGQPLDLALTLACGQAFRWRLSGDGHWRGVVRDRLVELALDNGFLLWRTHPEPDEALVRDYLRLDDDVQTIYARLAEMDAHVGDLTRRFHGMRLLRQDPEEALLSFVCSAANSIPRISASIEALALFYGDLVCELDGVCWFGFPTARMLAGADAVALSDAPSLGFRGANLKAVAEQLVGRGEVWLQSLRSVPYTEARDALVELRGVGRKIADCVCLFALDKDEAVPVDTHVRQIAERLWMPTLKGKTITNLAYRMIVGAFADRYGPLAGWAQQFLFYEDLLRTRAMGRGL